VTFIVYRSPFTCFKRFLPLNFKTGSSFGRQVVPQTNSDVTNRFRSIGFLLGGLLMFVIYLVPLKSYAPFSGCALKFGCKFAFEAKFYEFDP
jgi:hypothetical protein